MRELNDREVMALAMAEMMLPLAPLWSANITNMLRGREGKRLTRTDAPKRRRASAKSIEPRH